MLDVHELGTALKANGFDFYVGVPCSYLKDMINYAINDCTYIAAANEGDAIAVAAGAYLGGKKPVVLMQNSGLTNASSPLTSLNPVFEIPILGFVSLRSETSDKDEPQHELMGQITIRALELMGISWEFLTHERNCVLAQLRRACNAFGENRSFFFIVRKDTFESVTLLKRGCHVVHNKKKIRRTRSDSLPQRIEVLNLITKIRDRNTALIATTGYTSRELYSAGDDESNIYLVGSMGCVGSVGLGLALARKDRDVFVIDGDGSLLMRMGSMAVTAHYSPTNLIHILLDNCMYESTGGQMTVSRNVDFIDLAAALGYDQSFYVHDLGELEGLLREWKRNKALTFIYFRIAPGTKKDLPRPKIRSLDVKRRFMRAFCG